MGAYADRAPMGSGAGARRGDPTSPDAIKWGLEKSVGAQLAGPLTGAITDAIVGEMLDERLLRKAEGLTELLPERTLLVLDERGSLHLIGLKGASWARLGEDLARWSVDEVTVAVKSDNGRLFRPLEIAFWGTRLLLAAPWMNSRQRAALEEIERVTAGGDPVRPTGRAKEEPGTG